jgi:putative ABC transport system permease protein
MIGHLLTLTWNRRRTNLLLMLEIFAAFLALVALSTFAFWAWRDYHRPRGFSVQDVWRVRIQRSQVVPNLPKKTSLGPIGYRANTPPPKGPPPTLREVLAAVAALPQVSGVAAMDGGVPFHNSRAGRRSRIGGRRYRFGVATDNLPAVLGIHLSRGRWFGREDDGASHRPVVVTEAFARAHFGEADPIGRELREDPPTEVEVQRGERLAPGPGGQPRPPVLRVVGVVPRYLGFEPFKGEYGEQLDFLFERLVPEDGEAGRMPNLLVRVRPGTTATFEETLARTVQSVARGWYFETTYYEAGLRKMAGQVTTLFAGLGVLGGFLLLMVTLGLSGVVWQNVTQRTAEIGLRRAQGATAGDIRRQFLGELGALATVAMAAGAVVVLHFAGVIAHLSYFDVGWLSWDVYAVGFGLSALVIYLLVMLAGIIPAHLAARIQPLAALRQE